MINQDQFTFLECSESSLKKFDLQVKDKRELLNLLNEQFYRKLSKSTKDKLETLDLRDKVLKLIRHEINLHQSNVEQTNILIGTCKDMCPEKERTSRECHSLCHKYEISETTGQPDHYLMIKEYSRSSADQDLPLPNEMRPLPVLYDTMLYLIDQVISKIETFMGIDNNAEAESEFSVGEWYDFVWNRTRSIRKDIIQQRLLLNDNNSQLADEFSADNDIIKDGLGGVLIIEQCARFHIMCAHRLCDQSYQVFDFKINEENLKNCFQSLRQYYETSRENKNLEPSPNEAEFRSYIILLNLTESNILCEIQRWPEHIRHSRHVRFALNAYFAFNSRNYIKFFNLIKSDDCEYLQACILHRHFYKIRLDAFKCIFTAFRDMQQGKQEKIFPILKLTDWLGFDNPDELFDYFNFYGLEVIDDTNVRMKSSMGYDCFNLSKSTEDRLKWKRSLLVERKFSMFGSDLSNEDCLSQIISGLHIDDVKKSRFLPWFNYKLHKSFDEEGHFNTIEIEQMLNEARNLPQTVPMPPKVTKPVLKSVHPNKLALAKANELKKKAIGRQTSNSSEGLKRERKKSASSTSSGETGAINKTEIIEESAPKKVSIFGGFAKPSLSTQPTFQLEPPKNLFSSIINQPKPAGKPVESVFSVKPLVGPSLFGNLQAQKPPFFPGTQIFPSLQQQQQQTQFQQPKENLFESVIKKQDILPPKIENTREKLLDQFSENIFQSLYMEMINIEIREYLNDCKFISKIVPNEICSNIIDKTIQDQIGNLLRSEIQENHKNLARMQLINHLSENIFYNLLKDIISDTCDDFLSIQTDLEVLIYDNLLCNVFQKEFEIILKQIANEINNDLILDRLADSIYFGDSYETCNEMAEPKYSIFMSDMVSFLHQCIYECTRLNLNVNRELYFEIKQTLNLNQKLYLFRKWRLKLSIKLLNREHRRASLGLKQAKDQSNTSLNQQLHSISLMSIYGSYLLKNLNKLCKLIYFLTPRTITLIHCEKFHEHLNKNLSFNYKNFLYELLNDNYFNIIHNRDSDVILQIPTYQDQESQQIIIKTIVYLPSTNKWLFEKFFSNKDKPIIFENISINLLNPNEFSIKFCVKLYEDSISDSRDLFGSNSLIYVFDPIQNMTQIDYMKSNQKNFYKILKQFNDNLELNIQSLNSFEFFFISYLDNELTLKCIQSLLNNPQNVNFTYCLIENDKDIRNISTLEQNYEEFLSKLFKRYSVSPLMTTTTSLADLVYSTLIKYLEFLVQNLTKSNAIYMSFDSCVKEYNFRLLKLINLITQPDYEKLNWPIPELIDELDVKTDQAKWTLKHWNYKQMFNLIRNEFYSLCCLIDGPTESTEEYIELSLIETNLFKYLNSLLDRKKLNLDFDSSDQCRLINTFKSNMENLKKVSITKNGLFKDQRLNTNGKLFISKSNINWTIFIQPIIDFILSNGILRIGNDNKVISLDQFYIFVDSNLIKSIDWIQKEDLNLKYASKFDLSCSNMKRRFSADNALISQQAELQENKTSQKVVDVKPKRLMTSQPINLARKSENLKEMDLNFEKFLNILNKEKENSSKFENRLLNLANDEYEIDNHARLDTNKIETGELNKNSKSEETKMDSSDLDSLLKKLQEEKLKNKQFNDKLNKIKCNK